MTRGDRAKRDGSVEFRSLSRQGRRASSDRATCFTLGAISLRSIPLHPAALRASTFPRKGGRGSRSPAKRSFVEIVDHRIGDRAFGDHADDIADSRPILAAEDDGGARAMAFQPREHQAENIDVPDNDDLAFDKLVDRNVGILDRLHPETRSGRDEADDSPFALYDDGAGILCGLLSERFPQRGSSLGEDETPLHDVLRLLREIEIDVPLLGYAVSGLPRFEVIDGLPDHPSSAAGRHGDGD